MRISLLLLCIMGLKLRGMESNNHSLTQSTHDKSAGQSPSPVFNPADLKTLCCSAIFKADSTKALQILANVTLPDELQSYIADQFITTVDPDLLPVHLSKFPRHLYPAIGLKVLRNTSLVEKVNESGEVQQLPRITKDKKRAILKILLENTSKESKQDQAILKFLKMHNQGKYLKPLFANALLIETQNEVLHSLNPHPSYKPHAITNFLFQQGVETDNCIESLIEASQVKEFTIIPATINFLREHRKILDLCKKQLSNNPAFKFLCQEKEVLKHTYIAYYVALRTLEMALNKALALGIQPNPQGLAYEDNTRKTNAFLYALAVLNVWRIPQSQCREYAIRMITFAKEENNVPKIAYYKDLQRWIKNYYRTHSKYQWAIKMQEIHNYYGTIDDPFLQYIPQWNIICKNYIDFYRRMLEKLEPFYPEYIPAHHKISVLKQEERYQDYDDHRPVQLCLNFLEPYDPKPYHFLQKLLE